MPLLLETLLLLLAIDDEALVCALPDLVQLVVADDIPMSPTNGRDSCYIGPYLSSRTWAPVIFGEFEAMIRD